MLQSLVIALREGLEAALVVSILITYLVRTDRRSKIPYVWGGVFGAVAFSALFGALLTFTQLSLLNSDEAQETFAGAMSFIEATEPSGIPANRGSEDPGTIAVVARADPDTNSIEMMILNMTGKKLSICSL